MRCASSGYACSAGLTQINPAREGACRLALQALGEVTMTPHPLRTGSAFALTVAVGYTACALLFWAFPASAANFMSSLFHGLDFSRLQSEPAAFIHEKLGKR